MNCSITITIGNQEISLDPGAEISANSISPLGATISPDNLRALYGQLKQNITLDSVLTSHQQDIIDAGKQIFNEILQNRDADAFPTILSTIKKERDPERLKALTAYASSLNGNEIIEGDNFFIDPASTYKASAYSPAQIKSLVFRREGPKASLFDAFLKLPGMNTLKMSIAYAKEWKGKELDRVKGAYITPDNIVQIVVPSKKAGYHIIDDDEAVTDRNLGKNAKSEIQDRLLHEMLHAVYTEAYYSDPNFKQGLDLLHGAFLTNIQDNPKLTQAYLDPQEFIASVFENKKIQEALAKIKIPGDQNLTGFDIFTKLIPEQSLKDSNALGSLIQLTGNKLGIIGKENVFTADLMLNMSQDMDNIFYSDGTPEDDDSEMAPRGQYDNKYSNNRKAFYSNKRFQDKWWRQFTNDKGQPTGKTDTFARDTYFKATVNDPSASEIDRLRPDDVVMLPWLKYIPADKVKKTAGKWQELGYIADSDGNAIMKGGKFQVVPIVRKDGVVQKTDKGQIVKEALQAFPVMYSNVDRQQVVVAKTNIKSEPIQPSGVLDKEDKKTYNTLAFPYELIRGYRQLDRSYFDHNRNFVKELAEAKVELSKRDAMKGEGDDVTDKKFSERNFYQDRVEQLEKDLARAEAIKQDMKNTHAKYGFSHEQDGKIYMNVTKEAYMASSYAKTNMDKRVFATQDDAVFILDKGKYKTKDEKDKYYTYPNPRMFDLFWSDKEVAKDFVKSSVYAESVSSGDLVRTSKPTSIPVPGKKGEFIKVPVNQWLTVYKKLANGIMVTTPEGHGYIVPFNNINAYAKNKTTEDYALMLAGYMLQNKHFNMDAFTSAGKFNQENINFKGMQFNTQKHYNPEKDDNMDAAIKRFEGNLDYIKHVIEPNKSYVRIHKFFTDANNKQHPYQVNGLVLAKSDDGLLVFTETQGSVGIEYIKYTDKLDRKNKRFGSELSFYMENVADVNKAWQELQDEKALFADNRKHRANFSTDNNGSKTRVNDPKLNPHGMNDVYDFYDDINGITLDRLAKSEGSVVSIYIDKSKMSAEEARKAKDTYERKVVRVLPNGTVVIAEENKAGKVLESGFKVNAGDVYARYIPREKIARIGFKLGTITKLNAKGEDPNIISEFNQDLINRRKFLWERSKTDRDYNKFIFASSQASVTSLNNKPIDKNRDYWRYIPLTNKILEPLTNEQKEQNVKDGKDRDYDPRPTQYLDKNFNPVDESKAANVIATYQAGTTDRKYVNRGIMVGTSMIYKDTATYEDSDGKRQWRPELIKALYNGDWITTIDRNGKFWDAPIERIENGKIYTLNTDLTTDWVNPSRIYGVRLSKRNDRWSNYKRPDNLLVQLGAKVAKESAVNEKQDTKARRRGNRNTKLDGDNPSFSLEASYKSPKASRRALLEIGNRLQSINPDIKINYLTTPEITNLAGQIGHDYGNARAFVLKGQIGINMDKASVSDVIHEYAHLFLHGLKYSNPDLYQAVISVTNNHSLYNTIADNYPHLEAEDLNEEVFVTVLGEYLNNKLTGEDKANMDDNSDTILDFAKFAKGNLYAAFNTTSANLYDIDPKNIMQMSFEDVINLVGDQLMNNKISDFNQGYKLSSDQSLHPIIKELFDKGLLTNNC